MPRDALHGSRFPLPENWEVEGTTCVTFVIPDDPEYLATLTGLVDELKWSKNFERDSTGTGAATVARTWQAALESQPLLTEDCDMPVFRLNDSCQLEVNCGTTEDPDWQPVFSSEHPGGVPQIPYPPGTPEYEDDTARCISAANITYQLKYGTETLATDAAIVGGIAVAIIDLIGAFLFFVPGGILVDIAIAIINLAVGHTAEEFSADLPDIDWDSVRDHLACFIERDGSMTEDDRIAFLAWMDDQYSGNLAWELTKIIIQNVNADGLTTDARMPQNEIDIVCGADECPDIFTHTFDFTIDDQNWSLASGTTDVPGTGLVNGFVAVEGGVDSLNAAADGFPARFITWVDVYFDLISGGYDYIVEVGSGATLTPTLQGDGAWRFTIEDTRTRVQIVIDGHRTTWGVSEYHVPTVVFEGQGTDPF
jgi:hypothetical protein